MGALGKALSPQSLRRVRFAKRQLENVCSYFTTPACVPGLNPEILEIRFTDFIPNSTQVCPVKVGFATQNKSLAKLIIIAAINTDFPRAVLN